MENGESGSNGTREDSGEGLHPGWAVVAPIEGRSGETGQFWKTLNSGVGKTPPGWLGGGKCGWRAEDRAQISGLGTRWLAVSITE